MNTWSLILECMAAFLLIIGYHFEDEIIEFEDLMRKYHRYCRRHNISLGREISFIFSKREDL